MGHSTITLTMNTYSQVIPEVKESAAEALNDFFPVRLENGEEKISS